MTGGLAIAGCDRERRDGRARPAARAASRDRGRRPGSPALPFKRRVFASEDFVSVIAFKTAEVSVSDWSNKSNRSPVVKLVEGMGEAAYEVDEVHLW
ncbi:hypothetical protein KSP40_PGU002121 [Platanthera guangdongensis]|uniref:Uncharacterized protein n=1 Tax=Platanthera guangdongensis TaxID=2320717 RepID=A0ABR2LFX1_9ASPA